MAKEKHVFVVGDFARSVECGWLGRIKAIHTEWQGEPLGYTMCEMEGVNTLCWNIKGGSIDDFIDHDDTQYFSTDDINWVRIIREPEAAVTPAC